MYDPFLTAQKLVKKIKSGAISSYEVVQSSIEAYEKNKAVDLES